MQYIDHYQSDIGGITLASDGQNITGLWLDGQKYFPYMLLEKALREDLPVFETAKKWLDIYFSGHEPEFTPPILLRGSAFRMEVWAELLNIPYGRVTTYGNIACAIAAKHGLKSMSSQAVGGAVGHNPISIIVPCHRVIGSNGGLVGYAGGLEIKKALLGLEGKGTLKLGNGS